MSLSVKMGMGVMPAGTKREVVADSMVCKTDSAAIQQYRVVSVDFCAAFRRATSPGMGTDVTPLIAMRIFQKWMRPHLMGAEVVVYAIDRPQRIPERRWQLYADKQRTLYVVRQDDTRRDSDGSTVPSFLRRLCVPADEFSDNIAVHQRIWVRASGLAPTQFTVTNVEHAVADVIISVDKDCDVRGGDGRIIFYKETEAPADPALADQVEPGHMPVPWACAYNTPRIKAKVWDACMKSLEMILCSQGTRGLQYVILNQDETVASYPPGFDMRSFNYGEGDQLAVVAARHIEDRYNLKPSVIVTNDIDIALIQMLRMYDVSVSFRAFTSGDMPDTFAYDTLCIKTRRTDAVKKWRDNTVPAIEIMTTPRYLRSSDIVARMHIAMLILCASRTDYCIGITEFGWSSNVITNFIKTRGADIWTRPWLLYDADEGVGQRLTFDAQAFRGLLWDLTHDGGGMTRRRCRNDNIRDFTRAVHDMLFTLRYWAGFDKSRFRGGPFVPSYEKPLFPEQMDTVTDLVMCDPGRYSFMMHELPETHP